MSELTTWINAHPYMAVAVAAVLAWLARHRGIGAGMLPGLAATPPAKKEPVINMAPVMPASPPMLTDSCSDPVHPALSVLRAGIDAGAAKEVMPAVEKLIAPKV